MDKTKFDFFCTSIEDSLKKMVSMIPGIDLVPIQQMAENSGKKLSSIVGVEGLNKGRIHIKMVEVLAKKLYEIANEEPACDEMDLCFYLAEFNNMVTGNGITILNNAYKGSELRLTPPAIFVDDHLDVTTPKFQSIEKYYRTQYGDILIEIGFEGV